VLQRWYRNAGIEILVRKTMTEVLAMGWDVGGAHLKVAALDAHARVLNVLQIPCPLWRGLEYLTTAVDTARQHLGAAPRHAITMTGEMADAFPSRHEGVLQIAALMERKLQGEETLFFAGPQGLIPAGSVPRHALDIASANWLATAQVVAAKLPDALLLDIGSTTADVIPISQGRVRSVGLTDAERLGADELVYTGVIRTPLMAVARRAPFAGAWVPMMAEVFATTADVYRLTGELIEAWDQHPAADNGMKTEAGSARRLARMIGRDGDEFPLATWRALAGYLSACQLEQLRTACSRVLSRDIMDSTAPLVGAGAGRFLVTELAARLMRPYRDVATLFESEHDADAVALCAPAVAVGHLALPGFPRP
jgi:probable H4MPT-linked C1 transfer pathway protein